MLQLYWKIPRGEKVREPLQLAQGHWSCDHFIRVFAFLITKSPAVLRKVPPTRSIWSGPAPVSASEDCRMRIGKPGKWKGGWEEWKGTFSTTHPVLESSSSSSNVLILHLHAHPFVLVFFFSQASCFGLPMINHFDCGSWKAWHSGVIFAL